MNITLLPHAAIQDAKEIEEIIKNINTSMKELNEVINRLIPERIETEWSTELQGRWKTFYGSVIQDSMEEIQKTANSLKRAILAAIEYSRQ